MTQEATSGSTVAERVRAADIAVGGNSPVTAMLANSLKERKPLADDGALHDTVQDAVNAASAFVFVPPGTFNESVTIDTVGLTLLGSGNASVIDGASINHALIVSVDNVTIESVLVRNDSGSNLDGIRFDGNNSVARNCKCTQSGDECFNSVGNDNKFISCVAENAGSHGFQARGLRTIITSCISNSSGTHGYNVNGSDNICVNNISIDNSRNGINIQSGDDNVVGGNRVINSGDTGIAELQGNDHIIFNNRISDSTNADLNVQDAPTLDSNLTGGSN